MNTRDAITRALRLVRDYRDEVGSEYEEIAVRLEAILNQQGCETLDPNATSLTSLIDIIVDG